MSGKCSSNIDVRQFPFKPWSCITAGMDALRSGNSHWVNGSSSSDGGGRGTMHSLSDQKGCSGECWWLEAMTNGIDWKLILTHIRCVSVLVRDVIYYCDRLLCGFRKNFIVVSIQFTLMVLHGKVDDAIQYCGAKWVHSVVQCQICNLLCLFFISTNRWDRVTRMHLVRQRRS